MRHMDSLSPMKTPDPCPGFLEFGDGCFSLIPGNVDFLDGIRILDWLVHYLVSSS